MLELILSRLLPYWPLFLAGTFVFILGKNYFNHGLQKYPGARLAHFTNLWRFYDVWNRRPDITHLNLHRRHGHVVRLGPNVLSFSSPTALKTIYGLNKGFVKSGFYPVQQGVSNGKRLPSLFSTTDEGFHANLRRCVNNAFSMSALKDYEPLVNETIKVFLDRTDVLFVQPQGVCNFAEWLQFFAFDVIGQITYSRRHGFIDRAEDVDGMVAYLGRLFSYVAPIGQIPVLDLLMLKNPVVLWLDRLGFKPLAFPVATFAKKRMEERLSSSAEEEEEDIEKTVEVPRADLLTQFLKAQKERPDFMTDERVLTMALSMTFAGSETTAISLAAVFYYLLKDKEASGYYYTKLIAEITRPMEQDNDDDDNDDDKDNLLLFSREVFSWTETQNNMPFLDACIKEAFRIHPAAGLPLERITPPNGITIDGEFIPGGTIVGVNAWVLHKNEMVFDPLHRYHVDEYRPERWLDSDLSEAQLKEMNGCMFQFGAGARTCIGKNISLLEIYKLVPSFLRRFDIEMANSTTNGGGGGGQGWKLHNAWFVKQLGFDVKFKTRGKNDE